MVRREIQGVSAERVAAKYVTDIATEFASDVNY